MIHAVEQQDSIQMVTELQSNEAVVELESRHSTVGAILLFQNWPHDNVTLQVQSLPDRIQCLTNHYWNCPEDAVTETRAITLHPNPMEARRIALTTCIVCSAPRSFYRAVQRLFLHVFQRTIHGSHHHEFDLDIEALFANLQTLQWLNAHNSAVTDILTRPLGDALQYVIYQHVSTEITGEYEADGQFQSLQEWKTRTIVPLLKSLLGDDCYTLNHWDVKLQHLISQTFCTIRRDEIFDVVKDYPDSLPAVRDLHTALLQTHSTTTLFSCALNDAFQRRLLHPGADTQQILQVYMNTIKVLREIDPTDHLLESVAVGIKAYLRNRRDTVKCIISSLTDPQNSGGDLYEELQRQDTVPLDEAQYDSDDNDELPTLDWTPAPSIYYQRTCGGVLQQTATSTTRAGSDLLSMLVGIYGSNDLFVDEYRIRLADKLLTNIEFDTDIEVHTLELLKRRFGETSMRKCEIMIKDLSDSKRIAANIHSTLASDQDWSNTTIVESAIISHIFWPALQKEPMKNHPRIQAMLDRYSLEYGKYKNPRRLAWFPQLGQVQLDLDVIVNEETGETKTKSFTCTPLRATLITHFEDNDGCWTLSQLSNETGVTEDIIQQKMMYWINHRVIKTNCNNRGEVVYELVDCDNLFYNEINSDDDDDAKSYMDEDDEMDGLMVSLSKQEEEQENAFESYIVGMLSNSKQILSLNHIHNKLKIIVTGSEHKYSMTCQQLSVFLQKMCLAEKIEQAGGGTYKIMKK